MMSFSLVDGYQVSNESNAKKTEGYSETLLTTYDSKLCHYSENTIQSLNAVKI
jgi:hypothetical protein